MPLLAVSMLLVFAAAFVLFYVGAAGALRTRAQTAADAAALAGAREVRRQMLILMATRPHGFGPWDIVWPLVCAEAANYAARNDSMVTSCHNIWFDLLVSVRTNDALAEAEATRGDRHATSKARATVSASYGFSLRGPSVALATNGAPAVGENCIPRVELRALSRRARVPARPDSALGVNCGTGNGDGADVADLVDEMKIAILRAEKLLGGPVVLTSAYRTPAYQATLCATQGGVGDRCAAPGASLHNAGQAIDVANYAALAQVAGRAGMCQPFPAPGDDNVHFSLVGGRECGGNRGALSTAQRFGGSLSSFAGLSIRLVPYGGL